MRALGTADGRFVAVRHDDKEVNVTVVVRVAPRMRAIQPDLLGLKLRHEPLSGRLKQSISKHFHDRVLTDGVGEGKPRFIRADLRSRLLMNLRDGLQPTGSTGYVPGAPASLPARGSWAFAGRDAGAPGVAHA